MAVQPILLFVDQTYLADGTGQIQTAVPVPQSLYDTVIVPECRRLLAEFGPEAKEFTGGSLKTRNRKRYQQFLRLFRNLAAIIAGQSPLRMVITLDGSSIQSGEPFVSVHKHIALSLNRVGITDSDQVAQGFSRQLVWLKDHFAALTLRAFPNPLTVIFDNRYRYSQEMQRQRAIHRNGVELPGSRALEDVLTIAANCLLEQWKTPIPLPRIQQMTFRDSATECGLQAADLFCNLFFNYALSELGYSNDTVRLKAELCQELLPSLTITDELRAQAIVAPLPDGQSSFRLVDAHFGIRTILNDRARFMDTAGCSCWTFWDLRSSFSILTV